VILLVGVTGWLAYAHYGSNLILPQVFDATFLSAPCLITQYMGDGWAVVTIIFGITMIASTTDTLQSGMAALFLPVVEFFLPELSSGLKMAVVVSAVALVNVPAIIYALSGQSILQLFLLADLLCTTAVAPIFLGLWDRIHPIACFLGMCTGLATVLIVYAIADTWGEGLAQLVDVQGGIFDRSGAYAFGITPITSAMVTIGLSLAVFPNYRFEGYSEDSIAKAKGGRISSRTSEQKSPDAKAETVASSVA
jgi:hypothetical protein